MKLKTLADYSEFYLRTAFTGLRSKTVITANFYMNAFVLFVGDRRFIESQRASNGIYAEWYGYTFRRWSGRTPLLATQVTSRFINWLERNDHITNNPHRACQKVKTRASKPRPPFTDEEYERLKEATGKHKHLLWLIVCGRNTGMSISDCALLTWDQVDLENMMIRRERLKTGIMSRIPIMANSELHKMLLAKKEMPLLPYFPNRPEQKLFYVDSDLANLVMRCNGCADLDLMFWRLRKKAGVTMQKSFHNFRAGICSQLANSGAPTVLACEITGHSDPAAFKQYVTSDEDKLKQMMHVAMNG